MLLERLHRHWSQDAEKSSWNWDGSLLPTLQLCLQLSTARQAADTSAARLTGQDTVPSGAVMHVSSREHVLSDQFVGLPHWREFIPITTILVKHLWLGR